MYGFSPSLIPRLFLSYAYRTLPLSFYSLLRRSSRHHTSPPPPGPLPSPPSRRPDENNPPEYYNIRQRTHTSVRASKDTFSPHCCDSNGSRGGRACGRHKDYTIWYYAYGRVSFRPLEFRILFPRMYSYIK